jgi:hypothetical protein
MLGSPLEPVGLLALYLRKSSCSDHLRNVKATKDVTIIDTTYTFASPEVQKIAGDAISTLLTNYLFRSRATSVWITRAKQFEHII